MASVVVQCQHCRCDYSAEWSAVNRAAREGLRLFCGRTCAGIARRSVLTAEQKKARKAAYDMERRARLGETLRAAKRAAYYRDHEKRLAAQAALRAQPGHREAQAAYARAYNADPENKAAKAAYDAALRASEYGPFAEAYRLLLDLEREIRRQCPDRYERQVARGYFERSRERINERRRMRNVEAIG